MVAAVIARAWVAGAAILPWLVLLPLHGIAAVLAQSFTLLAAFHGAGLIVTRIAGAARPSALLACQWGIAGLLAASGLAAMFGLATLEAHAALVFGCAAVHTGALAIRNVDHVARAERALVRPRAWIVPGALLVAIGAIQVLGAAADGLAQPFDDDGHLLGQLARLLTTGALGDPIGFPRDHQLGGGVAVAALAAGASEGFAVRLVESLAFPLSLALALSRIARRDASTGMWSLLVVIAAAALALAPVDPLPSWTAAGLVLALYVTVSDDDPAPPLPAGLLAGALAALRFELIPIAAAAVWVVWWRDRGAHRRTAALLAGLVAAALPFAIARAAAWSHVSHAAQALVRAPHGAWIVRALLALAIAVPSAFVLRLIAPTRRATRWAGVATALALGGVAAGATGTGAYALRLAWPLGLGFALLLVGELTAGAPASPGSPRPGSVPTGELAHRPTAALGTGPAALITVLLLCVLLHEGQQAPGRLRWSRRMTSAASAIDTLRRPPARPTDTYRALLASVPAGATVAVWVGEPELLDYTRFRIVDLRSPSVARLRVFRWEPHTSQLASLVAAVSASFLVIEGDDARARRIQSDLLYRFLCQTDRPICDDDLEAIALRHAVVARSGGLQLVDLRR